METKRRMMSAGLFALLIAISSGAGAQSGQQHENPCAAPEYHQLDFILGSWNVVDASTGTKVAELEIKPVTESDCGLMERVHSIYSFTREPDGRVRVLSVYADNSGRNDYEVFWVER